jgi:hypothetical protein
MVRMFLECGRRYKVFATLMVTQLPKCEIPAKQTIHYWTKGRTLHRKIVGLSSTPRARLIRANNELVALLKRLRARGCALHLREVISLRAAQMVHDPELAIACMSRRNNNESKAAATAVIGSMRNGEFDADNIAAAEAAAIAAAAARRSSVFMSESWASRFLAKNGFTLRSVTSRKISEATDQTRVNNQMARVAQALAELGIRSRDWIFNMDETGYIISKTSDTTFAECGSRDVPVNGYSEREQVTVVETLCMNGDLLDRQVIFAGTTNAVFPSPRPGLTYASSKSHWANSETIVKWFDDVMVPHLAKLRETPGYINQHALLLLDAYSAHFNEAFLRHAARHQVRVIQIEPCLTSMLQPCDHRCGPNRNIKPIVYRLNDFAYLQSVIESMKRDSSAAATALAQFNTTAYNFKLIDEHASKTVVE